MKERDLKLEKNLEAAWDKMSEKVILTETMLPLDEWGNDFVEAGQQPQEFHDTYDAISRLGKDPRACRAALKALLQDDESELIQLITQSNFEDPDVEGSVIPPEVIKKEFLQKIEQDVYEVAEKLTQASKIISGANFELDGLHEILDWRGSLMSIEEPISTEIGKLSDIIRAL